MFKIQERTWGWTDAFHPCQHKISKVTGHISQIYIQSIKLLRSEFTSCSSKWNYSSSSETS